MRSILFIAHFFPPTGGGGVQRSAKFVKYFPEFGVLPIVITGESNPKDRWSPPDKSLISDVPTEVSVYKAVWNFKEKNLRRRRKSRFEALIRESERAIKKHDPDLMLVSMSPFLDAEIAATLSKRYNIPWVADLRDPWALDEFQVYPTFIHRGLEVKRMRQMLSTAAGIVMNTPVSRDRLLSEFPEFRNRPVVTITNGYDADDFPRGLVRKKRERFRIVHTGTFHTCLGLQQESRRMIYSLLGRCRSGMKILPRSPVYLLKALELISIADREMFQRIEIIFAGVMSKEDQELISKSPVGENIVSTGYLDHAESVEFTRSADLLFLPLHKVKNNEQSSIVPGKTYEYIGSGNPILAALPEGDAKRFVETAGNCWVSEPDDFSGLAEGIRYFFHKWESGTISYHRNDVSLAAFERRILTSQLAEFLESVIADYQGKPLQAVECR